MYSYPLKFEFPMISLGRQVDVRNGDGRFIMRASDPFISFKDAMSYVDGGGREVFRAEGDSSFRLMFQFASMSSEWNIVTADGKPLAHGRVQGCECEHHLVGSRDAKQWARGYWRRAWKCSG